MLVAHEGIQTKFWVILARVKTLPLNWKKPSENNSLLKKNKEIIINSKGTSMVKSERDHHGFLNDELEKLRLTFSRWTKSSNLLLRLQRGCIFFASSNAAEYHLPTYLRFILRSLGLSLNIVVLCGIMPSLSNYQIASSECRSGRCVSSFLHCTTKRP